MGKKVNKVVLAYSGGLDTSVILKWLIVTYGCEVVTMTADLGQEDDLNGVDEKALKTKNSRATTSSPCSVPARCMKAATSWALPSPAR